MKPNVFFAAFALIVMTLLVSCGNPRGRPNTPNLYNTLFSGSQNFKHNYHQRKTYPDERYEQLPDLLMLLPNVFYEAHDEIDSKNIPRKYFKYLSEQMKTHPQRVEAALRSLSGPVAMYVYTMEYMGDAHEAACRWEKVSKPDCPEIGLRYIHQTAMLNFKGDLEPIGHVLVPTEMQRHPKRFDQCFYHKYSPAYNFYDVPLMDSLNLMRDGFRCYNGLLGYHNTDVVTFRRRIGEKSVYVTVVYVGSLPYFDLEDPIESTHFRPFGFRDKFQPFQYVLLTKHQVTAKPYLLQKFGNPFYSVGFMDSDRHYMRGSANWSFLEESDHWPHIPYREWTHQMVE